MQRIVQHPGELPLTAERRGGLLPPGGALLAEGAGFVLGFAGFQGGLLGEFQRLDDGRGAAVLGLEPGGQLGAAGVDRGPAGGPGDEQRRVEPGHFADRALAGIGVRAAR